MRKTPTAIICLLILFACSKPEGFTCKPAPSAIKPFQKIPLIVFSGESNSGGQAQNVYATPDELKRKKGTFILNNAILKWENLDIGINNLIQHTGMQKPEEKHSWELQLSSLQEEGRFAGPIYIVKTGHGGSLISQWKINTSFSNIFDARVKKAITTLNVKSDPKFALFYSQGINDLISSQWDADEWEDATVDRFQYLRETYGDFPIVMTKFFDITGKPVAELNAAIDNVCKRVGNCSAFETKGFPQDDKYHFSYLGQKRVADSMIANLNRMKYKL
jgi:hypothetical protein